MLARNGRPVIGDLRYLSDAKLDAFATPLAKAQLGAALAMLGDRARAGKVFVAALTALAAEKDAGVSRPDYGSKLRDAAAVLALVAEANPAAGDMPADAIARAAPRSTRPAPSARSRARRKTAGWFWRRRRLPSMGASGRSPSTAHLSKGRSTAASARMR